MKQGMEESDIEGLATQVAPSHASAFVKTQAKHWQGYVQAGPLSREITLSGVPTLLCDAEGKIAGGAIASRQRDPARSENHGMHGSFMRENRESPPSPVCRSANGSLGKG